MGCRQDGARSCMPRICCRRWVLAGGTLRRIRRGGRGDPLVVLATLLVFASGVALAYDCQPCFCVLSWVCVSACRLVSYLFCVSPRFVFVRVAAPHRLVGRGAAVFCNWLSEITHKLLSHEHFALPDKHECEKRLWCCSAAPPCALSL